MNSDPRLETPIRAPTLTRLTVETLTTRMPASRTGPASGSSTPNPRWREEYPVAVAESSTAGETEANASAAVRTMIATA